MKIEEYIKQSLMQIHEGCKKAGAEKPEHVEFLIQLNDKGEVCAQGEMAVSSIKMTI